MPRTLQSYDAAAEIGLPVTLLDAIRVEEDADGDELIRIPRQSELFAAVAMSVALDPLALSGKELRFLREAVDMTGKEFADAIDCAPAVLSRWENGKQAIGGYAERVIRQLVCEELKAAAPGIAYEPAAIPRLKIVRRQEGSERRLVMRCERVSVRDGGSQRVDLHWLSAATVAA